MGQEGVTPFSCSCGSQLSGQGALGTRLRGKRCGKSNRAQVPTIKREAVLRPNHSEGPGFSALTITRPQPFRVLHFLNPFFWKALSIRELQDLARQRGVDPEALGVGSRFSSGVFVVQNMCPRQDCFEKRDLVEKLRCTLPLPVLGP